MGALWLVEGLALLIELLCCCYVIVIKSRESFSKFTLGNIEDSIYNILLYVTSRSLLLKSLLILSTSSSRPHFFIKVT